MDMGRRDQSSEVSKECGVHRQIMLARSGKANTVERSWGVYQKVTFDFVS